MFRSSLFLRLLVLVVAATLPAFLVLLHLQHELRADRDGRLPDDALRKAALVDADLGSVLEGARQLAAAMARFQSVRTLDPRCAGHMAEVQADLPSYAVLSVRSGAGELVCSSNPALASPVSDRHCLGHGQPAAAGMVRLGMFTPAAAGRGAVLPLCVAFPAAGGQDGTIVLELSLDWLAAHVAGLRLPPHSTVGIADAAGTTLVRVPGGPDHVGRPLPAMVLPLVALSERGTARVTGIDGHERVVGYVPAGLNSERLFVSIGLFAPGILAYIDDAARQGVALMALAVLMSFLLAALAVERFVRRPTAALLDAAQRWSDGDLRARAQLREAPGTAFGTLAAAFNAMAEALGRRRAELEELNATLEARVQERTGDLVASRNRLQVEIAERERTEAELLQAQKLQAVGQLAGGIAHDFNNLLTAIVGALDLIRRRLPPERHGLNPLVENALEAARRGGRLTAQLLAFSRRQRLLPVPTDLNVPVLALGGLLDSTLGRNIRIETDLAPGLWPAMVDPNQVEAVVLNLAINARDAMPAGGALTIRTRNLSLAPGHPAFPRLAPGDYVVLEVADTGTGMEPQVSARAFEPFFSTKPQGEGAGLGLSQVHGLALQSGGDVAIASVSGIGTTVTVVLPRAEEGGATDEASSSAEREVRLRPLCVLVVDDDRPVREMTAEMLRERGHAVITANDGAQALAVLERGSGGEAIDVMLADYVMPGMTGVALIQAAQVLHPGLRALLVTGNAETQTAEAVGPDRVMRKPFTIAQLEERLTRLMADRSEQTPVAPTA